jgi:hypothetical protein
MAPAEFTKRYRQEHIDTEANLSAAWKWGAGHYSSLFG